MLLRSLDAWEQLGEIEEAVQILLGTGMFWTLNRLKDRLEKAHDRISLFKAAASSWQELNQGEVLRTCEAQC
jgi:hypothetical protein